MDFFVARVGCGVLALRRGHLQQRLVVRASISSESCIFRGVSVDVTLELSRATAWGVLARGVVIGASEINCRAEHLMLLKAAFRSMGTLYSFLYFL